MRPADPAIARAKLEARDGRFRFHRLQRAEELRGSTPLRMVSLVVFMVSLLAMTCDVQRVMCRRSALASSPTA